MKCRIVLPVGLLTCLVCSGSLQASPFQMFRFAAEEAAVEAPPALAEPAPIEDGKFEATQKGCTQKGCAQKGCGPVCQKGCEPVAPPCRPRLFGWGKACCEPACGAVQKGGVACQKDCGPVCQKGCGPVQKGFDLSKDAEVPTEAQE